MTHILSTTAQKGFIPVKNPETPTISRGDLNKALFMGTYYSFESVKTGKSTQKFESGPVKAHLKDTQDGLEVNFSLKGDNQSRQIDLRFKKDANNELRFEKGVDTINGAGQKLAGPTQVTKALTTIYQYVRAEVDPKWRVDMALAREAREVAGQQLNAAVDVMPTFDIQQTASGSRMAYNAPKSGKDKVCNGDCGKCRLAL